MPCSRLGDSEEDLQEAQDALEEMVEEEEEEAELEEVEDLLEYYLQRASAIQVAVGGGAGVYVGVGGGGAGTLHAGGRPPTPGGGPGPAVRVQAAVRAAGQGGAGQGALPSCLGRVCVVPGKACQWCVCGPARPHPALPCPACIPACEACPPPRTPWWPPMAPAHISPLIPISAYAHTPAAQHPRCTRSLQQPSHTGYASLVPPPLLSAPLRSAAHPGGPQSEAERMLAGARDLEESIGVSLSARRYEVNRLELMLSIGSFAAAIGAMLAGLFGMNMRSNLESSALGFWGISAAIVLGCAAIFVAVMRYTQSKRIL